VILSDVSIRRPVFTVMVTIGLMTLGILGAQRLGVDLFPDISFPIVSVVTVYPGAGPEEVEQQVTKLMEESVSSINGVQEVRSYSRDSVSTLVVLFKLEADIKASATDVRDRLAAIRSKLPKDIYDPVIQRMDPTALPIVTYAVSSGRDSAETRRIVEDVIKPRLEAIDGVATVNVTGGKEREIHVHLDRTRLESLGLSVAGVAQQLATEGFDLPGGRVTRGDTELTVKTLGRFRSLEELSGVVVASLADGSQVKLSDVAQVEDGFKEVRTQTLLDGKEAVSFDVQKQGGSNTVAIADRVYEVVAELEGTVLPKDVKLVKAIDASVFIRRNIYDVTEAIVFGGAMAILIIFLFMLDWRSTLISSLALPTSVVTTFLVMWWLGFTFNMMSLLGLSLAIGLLIDDAVVVRENIYRHMERGEDPVTAAQKGTDEIGLAVMATTFTIVAVFVPVAFMDGIVGRMFRQFGLTVAAAVLVSLFVSFTLDPMMSARVVKAIEPGHHERLKAHRIYGPIVRFYEGMDAWYRGVLGWALSHRKTVAFGAIALFIGSLMLTPLMGKEFVSVEDRGEFRVNLELPPGTSFGEMRRVADDVERRLRQNPQVRTLFTTVGPQDEANKASLRVYTTKFEERPDVTQSMIQEDIRQRLRDIPGLKFIIADLGLVEGPAVELPITLYVRGDDYEQLQDYAKRALALVRETRGVKDPDTSFRSGKPEANVQVNRALAADLGVSVGTVAQTLRLALEGDVVAKYRQGDRDIDIRLQLRPEDRATVEGLSALTVPAMGRRLNAAPTAPRLVRLSDVSSVENVAGPATIERMNRQRQIIIMANVDGRSLGEVVADIDGKLAKLEKPAGFSYEFGGQTKNMKETFDNMGLALLVAVLFIYFVLASQFESFIHPFTIMIALPLAIVGALLGLFLTNFPIGMPAMIGIILLMGLVTKNAILLVDYTNELREHGKGIMEALLEAGPTRLRPILMTSAAMVLGMLPTAMARGEGSAFRAPMALSVIGGVIASTVLTLVVVPVVYVWMDRFTRRGRAEAKAQRVQPAPMAAPTPLTAKPAALTGLGKKEAAS
jgi:hydrophobic/amphiphilic exporter-1 (mainly G- bacteria), HAE1 family